MLRHIAWYWFAAALLAAGCEPATDRTPEETSTSAEAERREPTSAEQPSTREVPRLEIEQPPCRQDRLEPDPVILLTGEDPVALAERVATRTHRCSDVAVVAPTNGWAASLAVPVALAEDAPLLLADPADPSRLRGALDRLDSGTVIAVGLRLDLAEYDVHHLGAGETTDDERPTDDGSQTPPDGQTRSDQDRGATDDALTPPGRPVGAEPPATHSELAVIVAEHLGTRSFVAAGEHDQRGRTAALLRTDPSTAVLPIPDDDAELERLARSLPATARVRIVAGNDAETIADRLLSVGVDAEVLPEDRWPEGEDTSWLIDPDQPSAGAIAAAAALARNEALLPVDGTDLRAGRSDTLRVRETAPSRAVLLGDLTDHALWQFEVVRDGPPLPGGGFRLFEDERIVALYGNPAYPELGALGEQELDATVERLREAAAPYDGDGRRVLPAFEIISTVASASAGPQGDFSDRTDPEQLRPYIDRAAAEGFYVILDLQPGRTEFLAQAQEYEELLREPHVGLALDPEWRIGPDERHLERVGHVEVDEVQRVADWLAELTRQHRLPQKLLLLHQFTDGMLPDRDELVAPQELAVVVHMDGQGSLGSKYGTYDSVTGGAEDRWVWGWKNFYDEDDPTATPEQVLDLDPVPLVVTYQ